MGISHLYQIQAFDILPFHLFWSLLLLSISEILHIFLWDGSMCYGGHRATCGSWFSLATMWVMDMELRSQGLVTSAFTPQSHIARPSNPISISLHNTCYHSEPTYVIYLFIAGLPLRQWNLRLYTFLDRTCIILNSSTRYISCNIFSATWYSWGIGSRTPVDPKSADAQVSSTR